MPTPCIVPSLDTGSTLATVKAALTAGGCMLGAVTRQASTSYKSGLLLSVGEDSGSTLAPNAPVSVVLSSGPPCVVPYSSSGMTLTRAKRVLKAAHCKAGKVTKVKSHRRRNTVVGFSPRPGTTLASQAAVRIRLSRGRH